MTKKKPTPEEIILSTTEIIRYIREMSGGNIILEKHRRGLIDKMIWYRTEAKGKYKTTYQSERAIEKKKELKKAGENNSKNIAKYLRHDHVHMREVLINELLDKNNDLDLILAKAIGCTITKEEHSALPHKKCDGWPRYEKARIRVFNTDTGKWNDYKDFVQSDKKNLNGIL